MHAADCLKSFFTRQCQHLSQCVLISAYFVYIDFTVQFVAIMFVWKFCAVMHLCFLFFYQFDCIGFLQFVIINCCKCTMSQN